MEKTKALDPAGFRTGGKLTPEFLIRRGVVAHHHDEPFDRFEEYNEPPFNGGHVPRRFVTEHFFSDNIPPSGNLNGDNGILPTEAPLGLDQYQRAIERCLVLSNSNFIIVSLLPGINQKELAAMLAGNDGISIKASVLTRRSYPSAELRDRSNSSSGLIVWGYNSQLVEDALSQDPDPTSPQRNRENNLEGQLQVLASDGFAKKIIVLSEGKPHTAIFDNGFHWSNGPFPEHGIWELQQKGHEVIPIRLERNLDVNTLSYTWNEVRRPTVHEKIKDKEKELDRLRRNLGVYKRVFQEQFAGPDGTKKCISLVRNALIAIGADAETQRTFEKMAEYFVSGTGSLDDMSFDTPDIPHLWPIAALNPESYSQKQLGKPWDFKVLMERYLSTFDSITSPYGLSLQLPTLEGIGRQRWIKHRNRHLAGQLLFVKTLYDSKSLNHAVSRFSSLIKTAMNTYIMIDRLDLSDHTKVLTLQKLAAFKLPPTTVNNIRNKSYLFKDLESLAVICLDRGLKETFLNYYHIFRRLSSSGEHLIQLFMFMKAFVH